MKDTIIKIRKAIFNQNKQNVIELIIESLEEMSMMLDKLNDSEIRDYMNYLEQVNQFFVKSDFLAVSDVLLFEMMPIFGTMEGDDVLQN
ncbi:MAG: hypothetical protein JEZ08_20405 [Clostridiales bacterium]|nr:hypothetical protein [Clostridiales bacterium]